MKHHIKNNTFKYVAMLMIIICVTFIGCDKYLDDTQLPANTIAAVDVYSTDATTSTVLTGIFIGMSSSGPFNASSSLNINYTTGLYTDELKALIPGNFADVFYKDAIQIGQAPNWTILYKELFVINTAIDGINTSKGTLIYKNQWLGECYFLRALCYYYLVNIYGDVPLAITNDYKVNNVLSRAPQADVYQQMIADLKQAQTLLSTDYRNGYGLTTTNRFRPNRAAATALLARVYLHAKDWANAEAAATEVINDNTNYKLLPLAQVFLANSQETILSLPPSTAKVTAEYAFYNNGMPATLTATTTNPALPVTSTPYQIFVALNTPTISAFEPGDGRFTNWIRSTTVSAFGSSPATTFYFPNKYKSAVAGAEYTILLRVGEQYLIRAEARAMQTKANAVDDINAIRARARLTPTSLPDYPATTSQANCLIAIAKERQTELFTECGLRFFDLKRTGTIDNVLTGLNTLKGNVWQSYMAFWPIPPADIINDPNISPNPGYL